MALRMNPRHGRHIHFSPLRDIIGALRVAIHTRMVPVMRKAIAVPKAAPATPMLRPGTWTVMPITSMFLDGKMAMKLNTMSNAHIAMLIILGIFILPELLSMADAIIPIMYTGSEMQ